MTTGAVPTVKYFEDFVVGQERTHEGSYTLTEAEIGEVGERFAILTAIGRAQPLEHRVAAVSALGFDKLRNHAPARPGDELRARIKVLEARASKSRPEVGVVRNSADLFNQQRRPEGPGELPEPAPGAAHDARRTLPP